MKKSAAILLVTIFLAASATALTLSVEVEAITEMDAYFLKYQNQTEDVQRLNLTAENSGSIGCQYRIKGVFHYGNETEIRFSKPYPLWSSGIEVAELYFMPENYTGKVDAEVYSYFCEREEFVENITYQQTSKHIVNKTVESKTLEVSKEEAKLELPVQNGRLLPKDTPHYWKASGAEIENGTATIQYDPPIYKEDEELNYTVINSENEVLGSTTVSLSVEQTYWDGLEERLPRILTILLGFSLMLNTRLLFDRNRSSSN